MSLPLRSSCDQIAVLQRRSRWCSLGDARESLTILGHIVSGILAIHIGLEEGL